APPLTPRVGTGLGPRYASGSGLGLSGSPGVPHNQSPPVTSVIPPPPGGLGRWPPPPVGGGVLGRPRFRTRSVPRGGPYRPERTQSKPHSGPRTHGGSPLAPGTRSRKS